MYKYKFIVLAVFLLAFNVTSVEAAPALAPGAKASEARLIAGLSPQAHSWIKQEAICAI